MATDEVSVEEKVDNFFETDVNDSSSDNLDQDDTSAKDPTTLDINKPEEGKETEAFVEETGRPGKEEATKKVVEKKPAAELPANKAFASMRVENTRLKNAMSESKAMMAEMQRRVSFMEEQQKKTSRNIDLEKKRGENRIYLESLRDSGSDKYEEEKERLLKEDIIQTVSPQREENVSQAISNVPDPGKVAQFQARINATNDRINADFPDITNRESALFKKSQEMLFANNTQDQIDYMLKDNPEMFYTHVKLASTLLENEAIKEKFNHAEIDGARQGRVSAQGVAHSQGASSSGADNLTAQQRAWCKEMGYNPKEYAKFAHLGGK